MPLDLSSIFSLDNVLALLDTGKRAYLASVFRQASADDAAVTKVATGMYNDEHAGNLRWEGLAPAERTVWMHRAKSALLTVAEIVGGKQ